MGNEKEIQIDCASIMVKFEKSNRYNNKPLIIQVNCSDGTWDSEFLTKSEIQDLIDFLQEAINE